MQPSDYILLAQAPAAPTATTVNVERPPAFGWDNVAAGVQSGSWAIILLVGALFAVFRKPMGQLLSAQATTLEAVKAAVTSNTETLSKVSDTSKTLAETQRLMQDTDKQTDAKLKNIIAYLAYLRVKVDAIAAGQGHKPTPKVDRDEDEDGPPTVVL